MSEEAKDQELTPIEQTRQDYANLCVQIGNACYAKRTREKELKKEIDTWSEKIEKLCKEAEKINRRGAYLQGLTTTDQSEEREDVEGKDGSTGTATDSSTERALEQSVPTSGSHH